MIVSTRSNIEAVTVYSNAAQVTRVAELSAGEDGFPSRVEVAGLPLCLDDGSVRARVEPVDGEGDPPTASDLRVTLAVPEREDALPPADDETLSAAREEEARLQATAEHFDRELRELEALRILPRPERGQGEQPAPSPTDARLALLSLRKARELRLREERRALRAELERVARRRGELEDRAGRASSARRPREHELRKAAVVTLRNDAERSCARARLVIEYSVPGARWAPAYTARFDEDMASLTLELRALIAQRSGEDWTGVAVKLSTADAQRWTELPELSSIRIGRAQPPRPRRGWRPPPVGCEQLFADYDRAARKQVVMPAASMDDMRAADGWAPQGASPADDEGAALASLTEIMREQEDELVRDGPAPALVGPAAAMSFEAAAATPASQPASPQLESVTVAKRKSRMLDGMFGRGAVGGAATPAPPGAPPPVAGGLPMQSSRGPTGHAEAAGSFVAQRAAEVAVSDSLLQYGRLSMPAADAYGRGKLTIVQERELYLELLLSEKVAVEVDVGQLLSEAHRSASSIDADALPARHQLACSDSYDHAHVADAPIDVPSDGEFHSVAITAAKAGARISFVVVPRESCDVFRVANIASPINAPLLSGPVDVYVGSDYLVTSDLATTPKRAEIRLGLGVEQAVKVSRNTRYFEESAGLIGGALLLEHQIMIEVANRSADAIDLEVRERVPVLMEEEDQIKLEVRDVKPAWEKLEPDPRARSEEPLRGGFRWSLELARGETKKLKAGYAIRIASKHELVGGNRREV